MWKYVTCGISYSESSHGTFRLRMELPWPAQRCHPCQPQTLSWRLSGAFTAHKNVQTTKRFLNNLVLLTLETGVSVQHPFGAPTAAKTRLKPFQIGQHRRWRFASALELNYIKTGHRQSMHLYAVVTSVTYKTIYMAVARSEPTRCASQSNQIGSDFWRIYISKTPGNATNNVDFKAWVEVNAI